MAPGEPSARLGRRPCGNIPALIFTVARFPLQIWEEGARKLVLSLQKVCDEMFRAVPPYLCHDRARKLGEEKGLTPRRPLGLAVARAVLGASQQHGMLPGSQSHQPPFPRTDCV